MAKKNTEDQTSLKNKRRDNTQKIWEIQGFMKSTKSEDPSKDLQGNPRIQASKPQKS